MLNTGILWDEPVELPAALKGMLNLLFDADR